MIRKSLAAVSVLGSAALAAAALTTTVSGRIPDNRRTRRSAQGSRGRLPGQQHHDHQGQASR
jgi:hypothetical protein